jgi:hypothetical protein
MAAPSAPQAASRRGTLSTRIFPMPLCRPPNELAAPDYDDAQYDPSPNPYGNRTRAKDEYRRDHREIIRSRVAAVRTTALSRIQDARCAHPDENDRPDNDSNRRRHEQTGKNGGVRNPPRQHAAASSTQPVARGLECRTARSRARLVGACALHRRARHRPVRTEHAATPWLRLEALPATFAVVKE